MTITLEGGEQSGDGKRAYYGAKENDGWKDLRIEVDTDDCDGDHARAAMREVINRCNSWPALLAACESALSFIDHGCDFARDGELEQQLRVAIKQAKPQDAA